MIPDQKDGSFNKDIFVRLIAASFAPFVLCVILAAVHTLLSQPDSNFILPGVSILFYLCWGIVFNSVMKKYHGKDYFSKVSFFVIACLCIGYILDVLMFVPKAGMFIFAGVFLVAFLSAFVHILLLKSILKFPASLRVVLLCALCLWAVEAVFQIGRFSTGIADRSNPNMIAFAIKNTLNYAILGTFFSYIVSRKPVSIIKKPLVLPPAISFIGFVLVSIVPWLFLFLFRRTLSGPHGDPAVGAFMVGMFAMGGCGLFSLLSLSWGLSRIEKFKEDPLKKRETYLVMALGMIPSAIAWIIFNFVMMN